MKRIVPLFLLTLLYFTLQNYNYAQRVNSEDYYFLNWEENKSITLNGILSSDAEFVSWNCVNNAGVIVKNPSGNKTEVVFSRPGYYLFNYSIMKSNGTIDSHYVIVNAFTTGSYKERLNDLISLMTTEEKIKQLTNQADSIPRLGLRAYNYWNESLHGVLAEGATSFPQAIALGATWDPRLVNRVATAVSDEARALNRLYGKGLTYWSPTINIARDPRWGRNEESYSEDPYLLSRMGVAFIKGMQGDHPYYLKTVATPKHFIANNEEERRHTGSSDVDMRNLYEYYLPAFKSAIVEARAYSIMGAYNELNHVPSNANMFLMTDLLRRQWGFEGYVVSDCGAIHDMLYGHKFFKTGAEAVARSILAGCDLNCGQAYREFIKDALDEGLLREKDIDSALFRVLSARFRLGEFDPPELVPYSSIGKDKLDSKENRRLALDAARKSIVLLKNNDILPIDKSKIKSIAVIGPNAREAQLGIYSGFPNVLISPLEGIKNKADSLDIRVGYVKGCDIGGGLLKPIDPEYFGVIEEKGIKGLLGEYFDNMNLEGTPVITKVDSLIDFSFGMNSPADGVPSDKFSVRWRGTIIPPDTINYIGTSCDDGVRLYIDNKLIINDWKEHGEKPIAAEVKLLPGKKYDVVFEYFDNSLGATARLTWDLGQKDFEKAKKIAAENDLVILVLGITPGISQEELDRKEIELPSVQRELVKQTAEVNPNIVIVLVNGGPVALAGAEKYAKAIVENWYNGEFGGQALADVLFGDYNPGGKLPQTFYASTEQLPPMSDYDIINNPRTYMYLNEQALFPFGHGLSYTTFKYDSLKIVSNTLNETDTLSLQFRLTNVGNRNGDEVVQIYASCKDAKFKVPRKQLKRFRRLTLQTGESKVLEFKIPVDELAFYSTYENDFVVEKGAWEILIGSSSEDIRLSEKIIIK
ncbi:beta-glucosidase [Melioribacter roseus P3M-2]|uniref:Beta-glucosidase n=1 Tax=Melioribacter roseus (strain DSM 23840 / JCM 17771 / VKM B-2668 / P3M-2) TaxID=1191523 RepID=I6ZTE1_MELRP|nr:glycoside hydrolase family 3 protein [Melioribacter roseus]AFN75314.1 beta-glucosidase [Melioribacter roseus P3M-2]